MTGRRLTDAEVEKALRFARGALAATGALVKNDAPVLADVRAALREEMTYDEVIERGLARAHAGPDANKPQQTF